MLLVGRTRNFSSNTGKGKKFRYSWYSPEWLPDPPRRYAVYAFGYFPGVRQQGLEIDQ